MRWLLLIHQLPPRPAYLRVKVWRRVLRIGAIGLRGSVYVLPNGEHTLEDFQWLTREIVAAGGEASVCEATFIDGTSNADLEDMFRAARDADYAAVADEVRKLRRKKAMAADDVARLRQRLEDIVAIDFFDAPRRDAVQLLVGGLDAKPRARETGYRKRTWVTRAGIKIDRMACAWLIRRFIDRDAVFRWVDASTYAHAAGELRFDMSDGEFTHEGQDCSFETLVRRFELRDPAVTALAELVHDIDLKDDRFRRPEALGLAHVVTGIAASTRDDERRLASASAVFDDLYAYFNRASPAATATPRGGEGRVAARSARRAPRSRRGSRR